MVGLQIHFRAGKVGMLEHLDTLWGGKLHFQLIKKGMINAMEDLEHREKALSHSNYGITRVRGVSHLWCPHQL